MENKESNLTLATLLYATSCLNQGDWAVLRDLNFGEKEITALDSLKLNEFRSFADRLDGHILNIQLDRERFWLVLEEMKQEQTVEQLKSELVTREAPVDMMRQLFGMTDRQYTMLRRRIRCGRRGAGRPAEPDTETMETIWRAWHHHMDGKEPQSAHDWLTLSDKTDTDCRTLWRFIRGPNAIARTS